MFLLSPFQRILLWRDFRSTLYDLDELDKLNAVAEFWSKLPLVTYVIDWHQPQTWPTCWQLLHDGYFDTCAVAYLMEQTLILIGWDPSRLKLLYIKNTKIEEQMMTLLIDDKWALNYSYGEVFDFCKIKNDCLILATYQVVDGKRIAS